MVSKIRIWESRKKRLSGSEGLLAIVGLEVTTEGIRTGTSSENWMERVLNFMGCSPETVGIK